MLVVRFKVKCLPGKVEEALPAFRAVIAPSRALAGCLHFDIARDLADPNCLIATEVFENREALDRQERLPAVQSVIAKLESWLAAPPEATIFHVSSSEPWG